METTLAKIKLIPVVRAIALISQGKTKARACELAGISVDTFDNKLNENPALVSDFLVEERAKITSQYQEVMDARAQILRELVTAALDPEVNVKTKLAIDERLAQMQESMELELGLIDRNQPLQLPGNGAGGNNAETFLENLQGPALRRGQGKATVRETTIEFSLSDDKDREPVQEGEVLDTKE